VKEEV